MSMKRQISKISKDQRGVVSIIVTLFLMIVITLVVVSFALNSNREQRQALDRQLGTQAFYAAESAINDAAKAILNGSYTRDKTTCANQPQDAPYFTDTESVLDAAHGISYTCLLISQSPSSVKYRISNDQAVSADMSFDDSSGTPQAASDVIFKWQASITPYSFPNPSYYPRFPLNTCGGGGWCADTGLLRVAATDLSTGDYSRDGLNANTYTTYLWPNTNGNSGTNSSGFVAQGSANGYVFQGQIISSDCSSLSFCIAKIHFSTPVTHVFFRIGALYSYYDQNVTITAQDSTSAPLGIAGDQALIDATGKAGDVLRRVQVSLPLHSQVSSPFFTVQSLKGICKQLQVSATGGSDPSNCLL